MDTSARAPRGLAAKPGKGARAAGVLGVLLLGALAGLAGARAAGPEHAAQLEPLRVCPLVVSADGRLLTQQWTTSQDCAETVRTRVTDRFLGFTCTQEFADDVVCRPFLPPPGSRAFDTSRRFRCVDFAVTDTELGIVFSRMREWLEPTRSCDWNRSGELPAMEVDFAGGRVCVLPGGLCMSVALLTPIGKVRLRGSIEKALREFGLVRSDEAGASASAVRARRASPPVAAMARVRRMPDGR